MSTLWHFLEDTYVRQLSWTEKHCQRTELFRGLVSSQFSCNRTFCVATTSHEGWQQDTEQLQRARLSPVLSTRNATFCFRSISAWKIEGKPESTLSSRSSLKYIVFRRSQRHEDYSTVRCDGTVLPDYTASHPDWRENHTFPTSTFLYIWI